MSSQSFVYLKFLVFFLLRHAEYQHSNYQVWKNYGCDIADCLITVWQCSGLTFTLLCAGPLSRTPALLTQFRFNSSFTIMKFWSKILQFMSLLILTNFDKIWTLSNFIETPSLDKLPIKAKELCQHCFVIRVIVLLGWIPSKSYGLNPSRAMIT